MASENLKKILSGADGGASLRKMESDLGQRSRPYEGLLPESWRAIKGGAKRMVHGYAETVGAEDLANATQVEGDPAYAEAPNTPTYAKFVTKPLEQIPPLAVDFVLTMIASTATGGAAGAFKAGQLGAKGVSMAMKVARAGTGISSIVAREYGETKKDLLAEGLNENEATYGALGIAMVQALPEYAFGYGGKASKLGASLTGASKLSRRELVSLIRGKLDIRTLIHLGKTGINDARRNLIEETGEEVVSATGTNLIRRVLGASHNPLLQDLKDVGIESLYNSPLSLMFAGADIGTNYRQARIDAVNELSTREQGTTQDTTQDTTQEVQGSEQPVAQEEVQEPTTTTVQAITREYNVGKNGGLKVTFNAKTNEVLNVEAKGRKARSLAKDIANDDFSRLMNIDIKSVSDPFDYSVPTPSPTPTQTQEVVQEQETTQEVTQEAPQEEVQEQASTTQETPQETPQETTQEATQEVDTEWVQVDGGKAFKGRMKEDNLPQAGRSIRAELEIGGKQYEVLLNKRNGKIKTKVSDGKTVWLYKNGKNVSKKGVKSNGTVTKAVNAFVRDLDSSGQIPDNVVETTPTPTPTPITQEATPTPAPAPTPVTQEVAPTPVTQEVAPTPVTQEVAPTPTNLIDKPVKTRYRATKTMEKETSKKATPKPKKEVKQKEVDAKAKKETKVKQEPKPKKETPKKETKTKKVDATVTQEPKVEEPKVEETKTKETKPKETKPKETKPKETKPKETKPKETKPKETKVKEEPKVEPKVEPKIEEPTSEETIQEKIKREATIDGEKSRNKINEIVDQQTEEKAYESAEKYSNSEIVRLERYKKRLEEDIDLYDRGGFDGADKLRIALEKTKKEIKALKEQAKQEKEKKDASKQEATTTEEAPKRKRGRPPKAKASLSEAPIGADTKRMLMDLSVAFGVDIAMVSPEELGVFDANGMYREGRIRVNADKQDMFDFIVGHELTHHMRELDPYAYDDFKRSVMAHIMKSGESLRDLVKAKQEEYLESDVDITLDEALEEIVADYAGNIANDTHLLQDLIADRKQHPWLRAVKNIFRKILNFFSGKKGYDKMTETLRESLEYLESQVESAYSLLGVDPNASYADPSEVTRYSISSLAQAAGFKAVKNDDGSFFWEKDGEVVKRVTADDLWNSPIGTLIKYSYEQGDFGTNKAKAKKIAEAQINMFKDICNLCANVNDFSMGMEFIGSAVFTALKSNSDKQYKTTYDFTSICIKTQATIDAMSALMVNLKRGLTHEEIQEVYSQVCNFTNEQGEKKNPVPCPECYVFSRWVGIGNVLSNMWEFQERYKNMPIADIIADYRMYYDVVKEYALQKSNKAIEQGKESKYIGKDGNLKLGKARSDLVKSFETQYHKLRDEIRVAQNSGIEVDAKKLTEFETLEPKYYAIKAMTWLDGVYFKDNPLETDTPRVHEDYYVPPEVLFNLNRGEKFATEYRRAWRYRTTRGAAYGKAITPYTDAVLGEGIMGTAKAKGLEEINLAKQETKTGVKNPILESRGVLNNEVRKLLKNARSRMLTQSFLGGQRFQSTSDAKHSTALDYLLAALEVQAMGGMAQIYTKVSGSVPSFCEWGASINMSLMGKDGGVDANGNLIDTDTGGMNHNVAFDLRDHNETAGTITIGLNDNHIRALINQLYRDFVIPYHSSGGDAELIAEFRRIQDSDTKPQPRSSDYTLTQGEKHLTDLVMENLGYTPQEVALIKARRKARVDILTGNKHVDMKVVKGSKFLTALYKKLNGGEWTGVRCTKEVIESNIFPNEYWDTTVDYEHSGKITQDYLAYCQELGFLHKFSGKVQRSGRLVEAKGYTETGAETKLTDLAYKYDKDGNITSEVEPFFWKLLVDRRMYGNDGKYLPQKKMGLFNSSLLAVTEFAKYNSGRQYDAENSAKTTKHIVENWKYSLGKNTGITINNGKNVKTGESVDFIDLIFSGKKLGETRSHNRMKRGWVGVANENREVVGEIKIGEPIKITKESPEYKDAYIQDTNFDIDDKIGYKYYYPIEDKRMFASPKPLVAKYQMYGKYSLPKSVKDMTPKEIDKSYKEAVNSNDFVTQEKLVTEAARRAGYTVKAYHGTPSFGFTKPRTTNVEAQYEWSPFYCSDSTEIGVSYFPKGEDFENIRMYDPRNHNPDKYVREIGDADNAHINNYTQRGGEWSWIQTKLEEKLQRQETALNLWAGRFPLEVEHKLHSLLKKYLNDSAEVIRKNYTSFDFKQMEKLKTDVESYSQFAYDDLVEELKENIEKTFESLGYTEEKSLQDFYDILDDDYTSLTINAIDHGQAGTSGVYKLFIRTDNLKHLDASGNEWTSVDYKFNNGKVLREQDTRQIPHHALKEGYDGVQIDNIYDNGKYGNQSKPSTVYILFDPAAQSKSADLQTFDDKGRLIPLSKRFNDRNKDWRYSLGDKPTQINPIVPLTQSQKVTHKEYAEFLKRATPKRVTARSLEEEVAVDIIAHGGVAGTLNSILKGHLRCITAEQQLLYKTVMHTPEYSELSPKERLKIINIYYESGTRAGQALAARKKNVFNIHSLKSIQGHFDGLLSATGNAEEITRQLKEKFGYDVTQLPAEVVDNPQALNELALEYYARTAKKKDKAYEFWINSILSGVKTHVANTMGNVANLGRYIVTRNIEAAINIIAKNPKNATFAEFKTIGKMLNWKEIFSQSIDRANYAFKYETLTPSGKFEDFASPSIGGQKGKYIRLPSRILRWADEFVKSMVVPLEAMSMAYRNGVTEGLKGKQLSNYIQEQLKDENSEAVQHAQLTAKVLTFQEDIKGFPAYLMGMKRNNPLIGYLLPFVKTPTNILRQGLRYSPFGTLKLLQKLAQNKGKIDSDIITRSAEQVLAFGISMVVAQMTGLFGGEDDELPLITGNATQWGSLEQQFHKDKVPPMSVRIGNTYFSYARIEPLATTLAFVVDAIQSAKDIKSGKDSGAVLKGAVNKIKRGALDKSYFTGINSIISILDNPEYSGTDWLTNFTTSWIPNLVKQPITSFRSNVTDQKVRAYGLKFATESITHTVPARAGLTQPAVKRDYLGRPVKKDNAPAIFRALVPVGVVDSSNLEDIDQMFLNYNRANINDPVYPSMGNWVFGDKYMDTKQYEEFCKRSGELAKKKLEAAFRNGRLRVKNPTAKHVELAKEIMKDARTMVRKQMVREGKYHQKKGSK